MLDPPLETAVRLLKDYSVVPVFAQALMDCRTPVGIFAALKRDGETCFLLESVERSERWGRYSFIGVHPKAGVTIRGGLAEITRNGEVRREPVGDPGRFLSGFLRDYRAPRLPGSPRFTGGLAGYFGYDILRYREKSLGPPPADDLGMADCDLHLYDEVVAFDHLSGRVCVVLHLDRESDPAAQYQACARRARELLQSIGRSEPKPGTGPVPPPPAVRSNFTRSEFAEMVKTVKRRIVAGDIFQAVPSRRFEVENPPDAFSVYRALRAMNPSPYLYYFQAPDYRIAGASPETLIRVEDGVVTSKPIAGTAPRGRDEAEDKRLEKALLSDEKERAEHTMLVDLGRNDVGRVSRYGTVEVRDFMHVERASRVMHLVSEVRGELAADQTPADALLSALPAGTLSGAPKLRAMQIIDEVEKTKRGVYGGGHRLPRVRREPRHLHRHPHGPVPERKSLCPGGRRHRGRQRA